MLYRVVLCISAFFFNNAFELESQSRAVLLALSDQFLISKEAT